MRLGNDLVVNSETFLPPSIGGPAPLIGKEQKARSLSKSLNFGTVLSTLLSGEAPIFDSASAPRAFGTPSGSGITAPYRELLLMQIRLGVFHTRVELLSKAAEALSGTVRRLQGS